MKIGNKYKHYNNYQIYEIVGFPAFQDKSGIWVYDALVLYKNNSNELFIRNKAEFIKKFKKV